MKKIIDNSDIKLFLPLLPNQKLALWVAINQKLLKIQKIDIIYIMTGMVFHIFWPFYKAK